MRRASIDPAAIVVTAATAVAAKRELRNKERLAAKSGAGKNIEILFLLKGAPTELLA